MRTDLDTILTPGQKKGSVRMTGAGTVTKTDGTDGRILVKLKPDGLIDIFDDEHLIVEVDGGAVPMRITDVKRRGDRSATIELANIKTADQARHLVGCRVLGLDERDEDEDSDDLEMGSLIGFTINDPSTGEVGVIEDIDDSVAINPLFVVSTPSGEVLIPAADEFVIDIDEEGKTLTMSLPAGLLNLDDTPEA